MIPCRIADSLKLFPKSGKIIPRIIVRSVNIQTGYYLSNCFARTNNIGQCGKLTHIRKKT